MSLRIVWRELALEISLTSLGSSQILRLPQSATEAARRFCVRRFTLVVSLCQVELHVFGDDAVVASGIEAIADGNVVELTS